SALRCSHAARNALTAVNAQERANTIPRLHKAKTVACGLVKCGKRGWRIAGHSITRGWQDKRFLLRCMGYMTTHTTSDGTRVLPLCIEGSNIIGSKTYPRKEGVAREGMPAYAVSRKEAKPWHDDSGPPAFGRCWGCWRPCSSASRSAGPGAPGARTGPGC